MKSIETQQAPSAIGTYSQATQFGEWTFLSGQIGLEPTSMTLVSGGITSEIKQVISNLSAVCQAAGGSLNHIVKLTVYLTNLSDFSLLNTLMADFFTAPYPARAAVEVSALPKDAAIEIEGIMIVEQ